MNKKNLQHIINMLVEAAFISEKDEPPADDTAPAPDDSAGSSDTEAGLDLGAEDPAAGTDPLDTGAAGGAPGGPPGDPTDPTADGTDPDATDPAADLGGSSGGGFGGGGGLGGGGGGGGGGPSDSDSSSDDDTTGSEDEESSAETMDSMLPDDPVQATIDMAIDLSKTHGDHQIILNAVKSNIQKTFESFDEAIPVIQGLWATQDPNLRVVARKLIMFIRGE